MGAASGERLAACLASRLFGGFGLLLRAALGGSRARGGVTLGDGGTRGAPCGLALERLAGGAGGPPLGALGGGAGGAGPLLIRGRRRCLPSRDVSARLIHRTSSPPPGSV